MTTDDAAIEVDGTEGAGFDALDALTAIGAVGDTPEWAHARGPEAVRHVVMGWATRALGVERRASAQAAALEALRAEVDAVRALVGPHLPLPDAVRRYAGVRPTPYGLAHPTPDGRPSEHDSPTARFMAAIAAAARAAGVAIEGAYASEEDVIALLQRIVAPAATSVAQATEERWATVELMGRTAEAGLVREEEALGGRVLVLRALRPDGSYDERRLMPAAVYGWRYVTEDEARRSLLPGWSRPCTTNDPGDAELSTVQYEEAPCCLGRCRRCGHPKEAHAPAPTPWERLATLRVAAIQSLRGWRRAYHAQPTLHEEGEAGALRVLLLLLNGKTDESEWPEGSSREEAEVALRRLVTAYAAMATPAQASAEAFVVAGDDIPF